MFVPPIPVVEIIQFLMKLRCNGPFLRISRILMLSLVALGAIGCVGVWATGLRPDMPGCTIPAWGCYQGGPLAMKDCIFKLGVPARVLLLPVLDLLAAFILLFTPRRTYLLILVISWAAFLIQMTSSDPVPYTNILLGSGSWLSMISIFFLCLLSIPLAIVEQSGLHPGRNYERYLPGYMK
jgi:hypothetical protein